MIRLICAIACFIIYGIIGIHTYQRSKDDIVPMLTTSWSPTLSWLIYFSLMISIINWAILAVQIMNLG